MPIDFPSGQIFVPYNGQIADITHADTNKHTLDLAAALSETRKIIEITVVAFRIGGTGYFYVYPNEGVDSTRACTASGARTEQVIIANGSQRLQYHLSVANDDWDLMCFGYVVEA